jgi:hypothetical protein
MSWQEPQRWLQIICREQIGTQGGTLWSRLRRAKRELCVRRGDQSGRPDMVGLLLAYPREGGVGDRNRAI